MPYIKTQCDKNITIFLSTLLLEHAAACTKDIPSNQLSGYRIILKNIF